MKQAEKTELTVARILEAAMEEFGVSGYTGGSINNICRQGISKGLIYHNFRDKDDLYLACLKKSCDRLLGWIARRNCASDPLGYMEARMDFFRACPREARIFFDALFRPEAALAERIGAIVRPFEALNERLYATTIDAVTLREGVTREDALAYFRQMQRMFNAYFSSHACSGLALDERIRVHEAELPKLLQYMLYGIAKGGTEK